MPETMRYHEKKVGDTYRLINIANDRSTNYKKRRALERSQDTEDEETGQIRRQRSAD